MKPRTMTMALFLLAAASARAQTTPVEVPDNWPDAAALRKQRDALLTDLANIKARIDTHNQKYSKVKKGSPEEAAGRAELLELQTAVNDYAARVKAFNALVVKNTPPLSSSTIAPATTLPTDQVNAEAARILAGIRKIQVPPPIPPEAATIGFWTLPEDEKSQRILGMAEDGVALVRLTGHIGGSALPGNLIFSAGKTFIAAENGADVYLVKENDNCEKALAYLKDAKTRAQFAEILRDVRDNKPLPENASIDMVRAAQAITDPRLGATGMHMAWSAMMSPEAQHAALTQATIELGGHLLGKAAGTASEQIGLRRQQAYTESRDFLQKAEVMLTKTRDPAAIDSLRRGIEQANEMIAHSYHVTEAGSEAANHLAHRLFTTSAEHAAEHPAGESPAPKEKH